MPARVHNKVKWYFSATCHYCRHNHDSLFPFSSNVEKRKKRWKWYSTKWIVTICWTYRLSLGRATTNANQREAQHAEFWRAESDRSKGVELCNVINHGILKLNARNLIVSLRPYALLMDIWLKTPGRQKWLEHISVLIRCWLDIIQAARATPRSPVMQDISRGRKLTW